MPGCTLAEIGLGDIGPHPFRIDDRQREDRLLRRGHLARLHQPRADDGVDRRHAARRRPAAAAASASCASLARSCASACAISSLRGPAMRQVERLLIDRELGLGDVERRLGVVEILLAHGAARRSLRQRLSALVLRARVGGIGLGGRDIGPGLRDLLGPAAVVQPVARPACCAATWASAWATCGSSRLVSSRASSWPLLDVVAFLHQHRGDALAVVERQLDLAQVDVAVEHELCAAAASDACTNRPYPPGRRRSAGLRQ